jgi:hypothetical protein
MRQVMHRRSYRDCQDDKLDWPETTACSLHVHPDATCMVAGTVAFISQLFLLLAHASGC